MDIEFSLQELLAFLEENGLYSSDGSSHPNAANIRMHGFSSIFDSKPGTLARMEAQTLDWSAIRAAVVLCSEDAAVPSDTSVTYIPMANPRDAFALAIRKFYRKARPTGISPAAVVGEGCVIGEQVYIGPHAVIGDRVEIGDYTEIHGNATVCDDTTIGRHCAIHSGAVIGADGFGYQRDPEGFYYKVPHVGKVRIGDYVEIGSNTCVARGKLSDTVIGTRVKIGNLCHISHDVTIGSEAMITHQAHIGGNAVVKERSWIAPGAIVKQGVTVGESSLAGMGAVVLKDVLPSDVVAGVPAKPISSIRKPTSE
ncbi:UDP-3-O-(3-hydroxymyristoyl)glucosamine N-acyltransferase [Paenibacillus antri]|uniref:UDP-3-O-(3-hydroxymyristoyl)glucosamine N-acyltransferase n=1 Tax=Paenibacillus antri TaxID=2582848 RepID=A0A5R9GDG0_9BACL|nr:UDP-3-O-(3-hydroxymyristoyl)glucosamine N-acyltransferase [Paenibacillus antri]TLS51224.1 UDP-3-O-(3-hydroxymyristoyl)glucosamine N-acyltransferase [Paenibacillus antri]